MLQLDHPFFLPPWRRWLTVALCLGWGLWELVQDHVIWGGFFIGLGVAAGWSFARIDWTAVAEQDDR